MSPDRKAACGPPRLLLHGACLPGRHSPTSPSPQANLVPNRIAVPPGLGPTSGGSRLLSQPSARLADTWLAEKPQDPRLTTEGAGALIPAVGRLAQMARAPARHAGGHRFKSCIAQCLFPQQNPCFIAFSSTSPFRAFKPHSPFQSLSDARINSPNNSPDGLAGTGQVPASPIPTLFGPLRERNTLLRPFARHWRAAALTFQRRALHRIISLPSIARHHCGRSSRPGPRGTERAAL